VRLAIKTECAIDAEGLQSFVTNMLTTIELPIGCLLLRQGGTPCTMTSPFAAGGQAELTQLARFAFEPASRFVAAGESDQGVGCGMGPDFGV
jgi:hypothetical protein